MSEDKETLSYKSALYRQHIQQLNSQREKIDELEKRLLDFDNTGMIGSSPAQFLSRIVELEERLSDDNILAAELLTDLEKENKDLK